MHVCIVADRGCGDNSVFQDRNFVADHCSNNVLYSIYNIIAHLQAISSSWLLCSPEMMISLGIL